MKKVWPNKFDSKGNYLAFLVILIIYSLKFSNVYLDFYNPSDPLKISNEGYIKKALGEGLLLREFILLNFDVRNISLISDLLVSFLLKEPYYFLIASLLGSDLVSLENLLLVLRKVYPRVESIFSLALVLLNPYYFPLILNHPEAASLLFTFGSPLLYQEYEKGYKECQIPSLNVFWFLHLNMFKQYSRYFFNIFNITFIYASILLDEKELVIFIFNRSNYKSFLFLERRLHLKLRSAYFALNAIYCYLIFIFNLNGNTNLNFVNWTSLTFTVMLIFEIYIKKHKTSKI